MTEERRLDAEPEPPMADEGEALPHAVPAETEAPPAPPTAPSSLSREEMVRLRKKLQARYH
jgi:hypothetical protein